MDFIKKNVFKIFIIFVLISAGTICTYTVWNYNKTASIQTTQNAQGFQNKSDRQRWDNSNGIRSGQSTSTGSSISTNSNTSSNTNTNTNSGTRINFSDGTNKTQRTMPQGGNFDMRNSTSNTNTRLFNSAFRLCGSFFRHVNLSLLLLNS